MNSTSSKERSGNVVETKDLTKTFGDEVAVNSLNMWVPRGSIFGFIGPSGCGKTTTVRLLTGVHAPTSGQVTVLADVVGVDEKKSIISLKGPRGNVIDLKVENKDHFKVVKKGDQVEAVYTEALAIAVAPAPKPAAKK